MSANGNGCGAWIAIAVVAVVVWQCARDRTPDEVETDYSSFSTVEVPETEYPAYPSVDYPATDYASPEPYVSSGYQDAGAPYGCTDDCSGHDAGWTWAEENGVADPADCGGNSLSFGEGCIAYAEEQQAAQPGEDRW